MININQQVHVVFNIPSTQLNQTAKVSIGYFVKVAPFLDAGFTQINLEASNVYL